MQHKLESILSGSAEKGLRLALHGDIGIDQAIEAHQVVSSALEKCQSLILDLTRVASGDMTFLQILISAKCTAANQGKIISLQAPGPSHELITTSAKAGFPSSPREWLGMPIMEQAQ